MKTVAALRPRVVEALDADAAQAPAPPPVPLDPTAGGLRSRVLTARTPEPAPPVGGSMPLRQVLGGQPTSGRSPTQRERRGPRYAGRGGGLGRKPGAAGLVALTLATVIAGAGSAWAVRGVLAGNVVRSPSVWVIPPSRDDDPEAIAPVTSSTPLPSTGPVSVAVDGDAQAGTSAKGTEQDQAGNRSASGEDRPEDSSGPGPGPNAPTAEDDSPRSGPGDGRPADPTSDDPPAKDPDPADPDSAEPGGPGGPGGPGDTDEPEDSGDSSGPGSQGSGGGSRGSGGQDSEDHPGDEGVAEDPGDSDGDDDAGRGGEGE